MLKMEDSKKKIIWSSGVTVLITAILILGTQGLTGDKVYGCEARDIVMPCDKLSKYYSLEHGKCWNSEFGNKLCRTGWTQDFNVLDEVQEPPEIVCPVCPVNDCPATKLGIIAYTDNGKYYCDDCTPKGCDECIKDDEIMMPFD